MSKKLVVFCDFDGTITVNDNIVALIKHFQPDGWEVIMQQTMEQKLTIQEGVGALFALMPSTMEEALSSYSKSIIEIRQGFQRMLDFFQAQQVTFLVTSGGIDFFVQPALADYEIPAKNIYCNTSDFSGERIRVLWPHPCDEHCSNRCGMCKTTIMRRYPAEQYTRILIGDGITDFTGARLADVIFARDHLATECEKHHLPYYAFETFDDVIRQWDKITEEPVQ